MKRSTVWIAPLLAAALSGDAAAEIGVGQKAPPLEPKALDNTSWKTLDPLKGKVVLYEFFAFW